MGTVLKYAGLVLVGDPQSDHFYKLEPGAAAQEPNTLGATIPANSGGYELRVALSNEYRVSRPQYPNLVVVYPHDNTSPDLVIHAIATYPYAGLLGSDPDAAAIALIKIENPTNEDLDAFFEFSLHFGTMIRP